jgi:hypothetical protein
VSDEQEKERERGGQYFYQEVRAGQIVRVDALGRALVRALPAGRYRFGNLPRSMRLEPATIEVPPVEHLRIDVTVGSGR